MSTELPERLSVSYPARDIELPPANELWERGRRRQRHRSAGIAVMATAAVAAGGFVVAGLTPPGSTPSLVISELAGTAEEATSPAVEQEAQPVPEPARDGDIPSRENVPEPADAVEQEAQPDPEPARDGDIPLAENVPEPADTSDAASTAPTPDPSHGSEQGADPIVYGWTPSTPPISLDALNAAGSRSPWYLEEDAASGLVGLDVIGQRLGSAEDAERLCGYLEDEKAAADAAVNDGVADAALVVHHALASHGVEASGDLALALVHACYP